MRQNAKEPTMREDREVARFIQNFRARQKRRHCNNQAYDEEKLDLFRMIGIDITNRCRNRNPRSANIDWGWKCVIEDCLACDDDTDEIDLLRELLSGYSKRPYYWLRNKYSCVAEYVLKCMKVGDVDPATCTRQQPIYSMRYILSYVIDPVDPMCVVTPCKKLQMSDDSCYFGPSKLETPRLRQLLDTVVEELPEFITKMYKGEEKYTAQELVKFIANNRKWFDHFPVSVLGTNPNGGAMLLTQSQQSGPRRLALSAEIDGPKYSNFHKCHVEDGFGYSYSFLPKPYMGGRCLRDYKTVAELGVECWLRFVEYLDPVSQICPPNAANILYYFGAFGGKINRHQDNNPNMATDPAHTSQLCGSSVMVVNFFHEQSIEMVKDSNAGTPPCDVFRTEHYSVYILKSWDDFLWYHGAQFTKLKDKCHNKVRVAVVYRWLGRRMKVFCNDYKGFRQNKEIWENPDKHIARKFPGSKKCQKMFRLSQQNGNKALFEPESV